MEKLNELSLKSRKTR